MTNTPNYTLNGGSGGGPTSVALSDGPNLDAFSRLRVGLPKLRLSALFDTDLRPLLWDTAVTAGGTVVKNANHIGADLAVVASGDKAILSTKEYFVYRAGQSQQVMATLNFQGLGPNIEKRAGYFDDNNGMFFHYTDGGAAVVVRSDATGSVVDTEVRQADWNVDTMDGTGPSGVTVDWTKTQILVMDFQALFVGRVRFYLDIDGILYPVHEQNHANVETIPYISTAKLPVRYEIEAVGSVSTNATMLASCATVNREGGDDEPSVQQEARTAGSVTVGAAWETVLGVRVKAANLRATLRLLNVSVFNGDADTIEYAVILNPSYAGSPTWKDASASGGVAELSRFNAAISVDGDGDPDVGHVYPLGGFIGATSGRSIPQSGSTKLGDTVPVAADIAGTPDEVWVVARGDGSSPVRALISWAEER